MQRLFSLLALGIWSLSATLLKADTLSPLGTADSFAVLGASTVTNTGSSVLGGNVGVAPGTSIIGFPPGTLSSGSAFYVNDGVAGLAQTDALAAYTYFTTLPFTDNLTGDDLSGLVLTPGVYFFSSSAQLSGPLTLNFEGLNDVDVVFQIGSTLTTASNSEVNIVNPGTDDNVFWNVGSSATLGTTTALLGTIIADQSITLDTGATIDCGSALALNGAVTLDTNTINTCPTDDTTPPGNLGPVPEPGTFGLLATGIFGAAGVIRRRFGA